MREAPPRDGWVMRSLPLVRPPLHRLPEPALRERLRELGGTLAEVLGKPELMANLDPLLRADFAVVATCRYHARVPLGCPVTALAGRADAPVPLSEIAPWTAQTDAAFALCILPGAHFFLHSHRDALLDAILDALGPHPDGATGRPA